MHRPTGFIAAAAAVFLVACTDIQDDAIERGVDSPPAMETAPGTDAQWQDTLHQPVPPAPGVENPGAGEPRTPAEPLDTDPATDPATGTGTGTGAGARAGSDVRVA